MMNRSVKELFSGGKNNPVGSHHRRGRSLTTMSRDNTHDENLDLFSKNRRSLSVVSSDESDAWESACEIAEASALSILETHCAKPNNLITCGAIKVIKQSCEPDYTEIVSLKLGRLSLGSAKLAKRGMDDLLSSTDGGKNDYDWLLTPPGTPLFPLSDGNETHQILGAPRTSLTRTVSTTKTSRLSVTQTDGNHSSRPARSSSATRSVVSSTQYNSYSSSNKASTMLNTSSALVSSYIRPSSPITRSPSTVRPSSPATRSVSSRSTTPSRPRPSTEKARPSQSSRPSTPTSRPQIPEISSSPAARSNSRPSTPTRRISTSSSSPVASLSAEVGRISSNGRLPASLSRPSSPSSRIRSPSHPVILPDPLDIPPNLRSSAERPVSAGRSRPSLATTSVKGNTETPSSGSLPRRNPSPINTRGRLPEQNGRSHGHAVSPPVSDYAMWKPVKTSTSVAAVAAAESTGFGRNISKKSLDMAIRHMDIRNGAGGNRSGTTLFPQSIRSSTTKTQTIRASNAPSSVNTNGYLPIYTNGTLPIYSNSYMTENENYISRSQENGHEEQNGRLSSKVSHIDIYESLRYDAMLFKDDLKSTNWLHSIDDKSDHGLNFDNGFESLPEPF